MSRSSRYLLSFVLAVGVLLFAAWRVLVYIDNEAMWGRMRETPQVRPHEQPLPGVDDAAVPARGGEAFFQNTAAEQLKSPVDEKNEEIIQRGKRNYFLYCAQCHGKNHTGRGTVGQSFFPLPSDLRSERVQSLSEGAIFKEISYGIPGGRQPPLASTIAVPDRWLIVAYVKSLGVRE